ncbi:MAG: LuxR C-terminal-related transcriptional regulator [Actinomycetota bacterium]|nr:LuxR C-terminal-related transcriptional regulator [Actinomycetota bacterium]MDH4016466.1 LuxR C-terminal-related transcriptional regulator [Actinomycetota bacterium]
MEPLTLREVQVLELLVARRSYSEIGIELFVSRNTVKSHVSHIYTKLGVSGRARAAETARQLGIL